MSLIESLTRIKNAVYGREVREGIHDGVFRANQIADGADAKADKTQIRQDAVEDFNNQVIQEMTDKDVISAPEIIQARGDLLGTSHSNLNLRIDSIERTARANAIDPDIFLGTDAEKLQQAIDHVLSAGRGGSIRLPRVFDITGQTLFVDTHKADAKDRQVLYFVGANGEIRKDDAGFMFDSVKPDIGDFFFQGVTFKSTKGANMSIINGDRIIRVQFINSHARDVDHIAIAVEKYFQSIHWIGGTIIGGEGYAFEAPCYYDFTYTGGAFTEHREGFLLQTLPTVGTWSAMNGVRLTDSMVEGLTGIAVKIRRTEQLKIDGMYFENNKGGEIDFSEADYLDGVSIDNCRFSEPTDSQLTSIIKWGGQLRGVSTRGNFSRNVPLHDTTSVVNSVNYKVFSYQDVAMDQARVAIPNIDPRGQVVVNDITKIYQEQSSTGFYNKEIDTNNTKDLNSPYIRSGKYHVNLVDYLNSPLASWGFLEHISYTDSYQEQFVRQRGSGSSNAWHRTKNGPNDSDWSIWKVFNSVS